MTAAATRRSTSNRNDRGGSEQRRRRRQWLVDHFGDGTHVACRWCWSTLTVNQVSPDRIIPGRLGGTYRRDNIRPSCLGCNVADGGRAGRSIQLTGRTA